MQGIATILIVLAIAAAAVSLIIRRYRENRGYTARLRERYKKMLRMPDTMAEQVIEDQLARLRERNPGQSTEWYLEKLIYDLERDRR